MFSCSNNENSRIPGIIPSHIELSATHPETSFQFIDGDYPMCGFRIDYGENNSAAEINITDEIISKEQTVLKLANDDKVTLHCNGGVLEKIEFSFMTIYKVQKGKYNVQLKKDATQQLPLAITLGFLGEDGVATAIITFKH